MQIENTGSLFSVWRFFGVLLGAVEHPLEPQRKISCTGCSRGVTHGICGAFLFLQVKWYASKPSPAAFDHFRAGADNNIMIEAVARAFRWQRLLGNGTYDCMDEIAKAEKIGPSFVSRVIRLALLAPDIVEGVGLLVWWCVVPWKQTRYRGM
jgi:hypothetical protein